MCACTHTCLPVCRVVRCPVFNRTVRYNSGSLSGIEMIVIPDNACCNSSIFCATKTGTASVWYFGERHLATREAVCREVNIPVTLISRAVIKHNAVN